MKTVEHWQHLEHGELYDVWKGQCGHELHILAPLAMSPGLNPADYRVDPNEHGIACPICAAEEPAQAPGPPPLIRR